MSALMTVKEVAQYLKVDPWTIYNWIRDDKIPAIRIVGSWRFKKQDIDKWLRAQTSFHKTQESKVGI